MSVSNSPAKSAASLTPPHSPNPQPVSSSEWRVHKFGGSSVASTRCYKQVAKLIIEERESWSEVEQFKSRTGVVVSAMGGVTDALFEVIECATNQDAAYESHLTAIQARYSDTIRELVGEGNETGEAAIEKIKSDAVDVKDILKAVKLSRTASQYLKELITGYGELWSALVLQTYLVAQGVPAIRLDARDVLIVEEEGDKVLVDWAESRSRLSSWCSTHREQPFVVITGYIASLASGVATTLKRNGSDYSASIFGALFGAKEICIWTDVDGVYSADPRRVPEAARINEMSYDEAIELAYFGAKVLHPSTMAPAIEYGIPIHIKSTFFPEKGRTTIRRGNQIARSGTTCVKAFSTVDSVALINVEGTGMMGVPGVAQRIFGACKDVSVNVVMISQASSEHSVCFAVPAVDGEKAQVVVRDAFYKEIAQGQIQNVDLILDCSILAAVGDNMKFVRGMAGRFCSALGHAGINIKAIAQGSSELNMSIVVSKEDIVDALRAAHAAFYLPRTVLSVGFLVHKDQASSSQVYEHLLKRITKTTDRLEKEKNIMIVPRAVADVSEGGVMSLIENRLSHPKKPQGWEVPAKTDVAAFVKLLSDRCFTDYVVVDCTMTENGRSFTSGELYSSLVGKTGRIVSGNVLTLMECSQPLKLERFGVETALGRNLHVINHLARLVDCGETVKCIEIVVPVANPGPGDAKEVVALIRLVAQLAGWNSDEKSVQMEPSTDQLLDGRGDVFSCRLTPEGSFGKLTTLDASHPLSCLASHSDSPNFAIHTETDTYVMNSSHSANANGFDRQAGSLLRDIINIPAQAM